MIAGALLYIVGVSVLLVIAAASFDAMLTARGRPARWVWVAALLGCAVVPFATYAVQSRQPAPPQGLDETHVGGLIGRFPGYALDHPAAKSLADVRRPRVPEWFAADRIVVSLAILCVVIAALRIAFDSLLLYRGRKQWTAYVVDEVPVLVSDNLGPAIVGLITPKIVLPRWTLNLERADRDLMLAHEREHVRASDGRLATIVLLFVGAMPWNPAAWYALRRLRTAIEVDCDRRVLRRFPDIARYGHLLVDVAQRATGSSLAVAGFSERAGPLARRIQAMTASARRRHAVVDGGRAVFAAASIVGAFVILPPALPARMRSRVTEIPVLAQHTGDSIGIIDKTRSITLMGVARDLPKTFATVPGDHVDLRDGECPETLRDDRDGTTLRVSTGSTAVSGETQRGDTTWTRQRSVGYYMVRPVGRYGVDSGQVLRVGCGGKTALRIAGQRSPSRALSTLDTPHDDRARRIADAVLPLAHVRPISVELFTGRLDVVFGDTTLARNEDAAWDLRTKVAHMSRDILGRTAFPETVTVSYRTGRDNWTTLVYYKSMGK
jgi:hypothetical protein